MSLEAEAASQVVSLTVKGVEITATFVGKAGSKGISLAMAAAKKIIEQYNEGKQLSPGEKRYLDMIRSGKNIADFVIPEDQLEKFVDEAKKNALSYCLFKETDGKEVVVACYEQEAARVSRVIQTLKINNVEVSETSREDKSVPETNISNEPKSAEDVDRSIKEEDADRTFDFLNPNDAVETKVEEEKSDPFATRRNTESRSETGSEVLESDAAGSSHNVKRDFAKEFSKTPESRPSVKKRLKEIQAAQAAEKAKRTAEQVAEQIKDTAQKVVDAAKDTIRR